MGIIPIWGFQMLAAIVIARFAKLNIPLVLIGANVTIAPFIPIVIYLSLLSGAWILGISDPLHFSLDLSTDDIPLKLKQYVIGSIALAVVASIFFGLVTYAGFWLNKRKKV